MAVLALIARGPYWPPPSMSKENATLRVTDLHSFKGCDDLSLPDGEVNLPEGFGDVRIRGEVEGQINRRRPDGEPISHAKPGGVAQPGRVEPAGVAPEIAGIQEEVSVEA